MIVYIPTPITSVEQAEALPVGTVGLPNPADDCRAPYLKTEDGWISGWHPDWRRDREQDVEPDAGMVGETALVPVEAEEEWGVEMSEGGAVTHVVPAITREHAERTLSHQEPGAARIVHHIRATPWKPVSGPSPDHSLDGREAHE